MLFTRKTKVAVDSTEVHLTATNFYDIFVNLLRLGAFRFIRPTAHTALKALHVFITKSSHNSFGLVAA
jgi:hypothetical protein